MWAGVGLMGCGPEVEGWSGIHPQVSRGHADQQPGFRRTGPLSLPPAHKHLQGGQTPEGWMPMRRSARPRETRLYFHGGCRCTIFIHNRGGTADGYRSVRRVEASSVNRVLACPLSLPPLFDSPDDPFWILGLFLRFLSTPHLFSRSTGRASGDGGDGRPLCEHASSLYASRARGCRLSFVWAAGCSVAWQRAGASNLRNHFLFPSCVCSARKTTERWGSPCLLDGVPQMVPSQLMPDNVSRGCSVSFPGTRPFLFCLEGGGLVCLGEGGAVLWKEQCFPLASG